VLLQRKTERASDEAGADDGDLPDRHGGEASPDHSDRDPVKMNCKLSPRSERRMPARDGQPRP
jgi:hypothetical protein